MCVLLFDVFKHLLLRKTELSQNKTVSQIDFKLFSSGDKRLLSEFLRKWGWFQGHNERFPKHLG